MQVITQISRYVSILLVIGLLITGCKSPEERTQDFVESYNRGSNKLVNNVISSTSAYFISKDHIGLKFNTNLVVEREDKNLYLNVLPDLIANLLSTTPAAQQMIDDGITFNISFLDKNNATISKMRIDEQKLKELLTESKSKQDNSLKGTDLSSISDETKQMLNILNANLPYEDPNSGIKILRVSVVNPQELTYTVEVPLSLVPFIKGAEAQQVLKSNILNSENFRTVISGMEDLGLTHVRYLYTDPSGEILNQFKLTKEDLN